MDDPSLYRRAGAGFGGKAIHHITDRATEEYSLRVGPLRITSHAITSMPLSYPITHVSRRSRRILTGRSWNYLDYLGVLDKSWSKPLVRVLCMLEMHS